MQCGLLYDQCPTQRLSLPEARRRALAGLHCVGSFDETIGGVAIRQIDYEDSAGERYGVRFAIGHCDLELRSFMELHEKRLARGG